jgi:ABC-type lipoprotein release transport system permease subunit
VLTGERQVADLHAAIRDPLTRNLPASAAEFRITAVRANALAAASGTTDFGEYFTYFSFFLVVSSLLLTLLFFRLGIEQRAHEIGVLAAMGYTPRAIRGLLLAEGAVLATVGAVLGMLGALAYSALIMFALRTLWVDAVGTTALSVHVSPLPLAAGAVAGIVAGLACIAWSLRVLLAASARELMSGAWVDASMATRRPSQRMRQVALAALVLALVLAGVAAGGAIPPAGAFFGSGALLLIAGLSAVALWLRGTSRRTFVTGAWPLAQLGLRNARYRPSRSVLSVALIAAATFLIVAIGAFRRGGDDSLDPRSATGGYTLIAETVAPLMHDPSTPAGRAALNLNTPVPFSVARFRLRPGDDASCLNLYRPQSPRLLGAGGDFVRASRFTFSASMAESDEERQNPWRLLSRRFEDGAVPVVGDSTSLTYVFHLGVGDDYMMQGPDGRPLRLRIVGALRDSVLQSELIMGDANFTRLFPRNEGFRVFLIATDPAQAPAVGAALEDQLQDFGLDAQSISERLASYHRVENTYLSTFQALGALGLVLGTFGLGTVLLRNVLERKRELALLQATGYRRSQLVLMVIAESVFLLACGLAIGIGCALVAIAPAYIERAQAFPVVNTLGLLAAVFVTGLLSTVMATRVVATSALLPALKNE